MEMEPKKKDRWSEVETKMLISIYGSLSMDSIFDGTIRNAELYKRICTELSKGDVFKTTEQVKNRIKFLKKKYKDEKDKKRVSGSGGGSSFIYFEELDAIMGHRDNINPAFLVDIGISRENDVTQEEPSVNEQENHVLPLSAEAVEVEDEELNNISLAEARNVQPCSSTPKISKGRKRKRKNNFEEALKNVLGDVTKQILEFEGKLEERAEEKREAFREKVLQQNNEMLELLRKSRQ